MKPCKFIKRPVLMDLHTFITLIPKVHNAQGEESIECAIYPVHAISLQRVMWLPVFHTAKCLIFLLTMKNRGVFRDFYARFYLNARSVSCSFGISFDMGLLLACNWSHAQYWIVALSLVNVWTPGMVTFRNYLAQSIIACLILSSLLFIFFCSY